MNEKAVCNYIFELGTLKKFSHCGTKLAGVKHPDSIADHVYRTTMLGYILAKKEKVSTEKVMLLCLLHDNAEARITDLHKLARRYIDPEKAEMKAFQEQIQKLPPEIAATFAHTFIEYEAKKTPESLVACDADMLETAFQAKEYLDLGYKSCIDWINNVDQCLKSKSAKKILKTLRNVEFTNWWRDLKKINKY